MCHKSITELSPEYREKAREIEQMISQRLPVVTQAQTKTRLADLFQAI